MDPITAPMVVGALTKVFSGTAEEVGRQAWTTLTGVVRRAFGGRERSRPMRAVAELDRHPGDPARMEALAAALVAAADLDPDFAADLRGWLADTGAVRAGGAVTNVITGAATLHGPVIQARDIHGGITYGDPNPR
ncbi:MAG TPA: hypothetical protein VF069_25490 [Streptosporangiaceae bacterium]